MLSKEDPPRDLVLLPDRTSTGAIIGALYTGRGIALLLVAPPLAPFVDRIGGYRPLGLMAAIWTIGVALLAARESAER